MLSTTGLGKPSLRIKFYRPIYSDLGKVDIAWKSCSFFSCDTKVCWTFPVGLAILPPAPPTLSLCSQGGNPTIEVLSTEEDSGSREMNSSREMNDHIFIKLLCVFYDPYCGVFPLGVHVSGGELSCSERTVRITSLSSA